MRQILTLLVSLCSLHGTAQFYVTENTTLSLESSQSVLSSQEHINQIDVSFFGDGTLYVNSTLVLGTKAFITATTDGQLVYTTQFESSNSLAVVPTLSLLKYTRPGWSQVLTQMIFIHTPHAHNFGALAYNGYMVYFKTHSPPPEFLNTIS